MTDGVGLPIFREISIVSCSILIQTAVGKMEQNVQTELVSSSQQSIYIVDDDEGARESIRAMLEPLGCRCITFESGEDFLAGLGDGRYAYGCAVIDLRLKGISGLVVLQALVDSKSCISPLLVTAFADVKLVVEAISKGAATVIPKPYRDQDLWDAVSAGLVTSQTRLAEKLRQDELLERFERLTSSEKQVLSFLIRGEANKQIALACDISTRTVDIRRASVLKKMGAKSAVELSWTLAKSGIDIFNGGPF